MKKFSFLGLRKKPVGNDFESKSKDSFIDSSDIKQSLSELRCFECDSRRDNFISLLICITNSSISLLSFFLLGDVLSFSVPTGKELFLHLKGLQSIHLLFSYKFFWSRKAINSFLILTSIKNRVKFEFS